MAVNVVIRVAQKWPFGSQGVNATDNRVLELYSYACTSGEQNAAIPYIILHLTYIRGLIHGIGRGVPNDVIIDSQTQSFG